MAPVTRLSRSFMMRLPVSKAITPLSNPTEKLEKMGSSFTDGKQHTRTKKNRKKLFFRMPLYLIPLRLCQIKKHERKQKKREAFVIEKQRQMSSSSCSRAYSTVRSKIILSPGQNTQGSSALETLTCCN